MRTLIVISIVLSAFSVSAKNLEAVPEGINMHEPPFWMSSYEEFQDLLPSQKDYYLKNLSVELRKIPHLENVSHEKLQDAAEWHKDWNSIRRRVYISCKDKSLLEACKQVAEVRIEAINLLANKKVENRKAEEKSRKQVR